MPTTVYGLGKVVVSGEQIVFALNNDAANPSLAFDGGNNTPNTGFYETFDDQMSVSMAGSRRWFWSGNQFRANVVGGPVLLNVNASATIPNVCPDSGDQDTGAGAAGPNQLSLIAGAIEGIRVTEAAGIITNALNGFTQIGGSTAPSIKMKKLTGTTGATEGDQTVIVHGLTASKILAFDILITNAFSSRIPPRFIEASENEYNAFSDTTNIIVDLTATNSGDLLSKAITVLITYEE